MSVVLAVLIAYLWGAVPTAYLLTRAVRRVDIRELGSGNVGASNVMVHLGLRVGLALGFFDALAKGTLPVALAALAGHDLAVQVAVGLAAVAGHNWSPFLRFTGGRGMASAMGVYLGLALWPQLVLLGLVGGLWGWALHKGSAVWMGVGFALAPLLGLLLGQPAELVVGTTAMLALLAVKRLTGNWERPPTEEPALRVIVHRLLLDRDIASHNDWVYRGRPDGSPE